MARSLGLDLFLRTRPRHQSRAAGGSEPQRPDGALIWLHASGLGMLPAIEELSRRLRDARPDLSVLVTAPPGSGSIPGTIGAQPPEDVPNDVEAFLAHWRPNLVVLSGKDIRPVLIEAAAERGIALFMIDAGAPELGRLRWVPGAGRQLVQRFRRIFARDAASANAYLRIGAYPDRVVSLGRLEENTGTLPGPEAEREALATLFRARPVWLAAELPEEEEETVIAAHRSAMRLAHRLLLILVPADPERAEALAERLEADQNLNVARRSAEEEPAEEVEVYLADTDGEMGLWYRLAPITYMGGTLSSGSRRHPFEPAALGSALIHGDATAPYGEGYQRLGEAGGARKVRKPGDLAEAVGDLLAPDRAAALAHGAWAVATSGAEATDAVMQALLETLSERGGR
ncbi:MAG: glycosyltransferase N-terminal domain-containing protein [Paracoccaceae bacterium]